jgi:hypothetical protein
MIDMTKASANKQGDGPWVVSLEGEVLYSLHPATTAQETFAIRDQVSKLLEQAYSEGKRRAEGEFEQKLLAAEKGARKSFELLQQENLRLANALEQHIISEEN